MTSQTYNAGNIQVLEGLEAVRMRPGMYIGTTSSRGLHHLLWEIVDNAIDEAANGFADEVTVTLHRDGSASVWDNGRGMPVDTHPTLGIPGVEVIFTVLHAGGKFNNENYDYSGGLHGVGASVVNALSRWLTVDVYLNWTHYRMAFTSEVNPATRKIEAGKPSGPLEVLGNTRKKGTLVRFLPDERIFEDVKFHTETVARRLQELAYLNKGVRITFPIRKPAPAFSAMRAVSRIMSAISTPERTRCRKTSSTLRAGGMPSSAGPPSSIPTVLPKAFSPMSTTSTHPKAAPMRPASRRPLPSASTIMRAAWAF